MGHVSGSLGGWLPAIDPVTGGFFLPLWLAAVIAALLVAFGLTLFGGVGPDRMVEKLSRAGLMLVGAAAAWIVLNAMSTDRFAPERQSLDARLLEITATAVAPGSALSCLSGTADEAVETSCEKALFATPEAVAAAIAYVAAQVSIMADGADYERRSARSYESVLAGVRLAVETDRFGIVAHVLATRDGCTAERCSAFTLLRDPSQISDNLIAHRYELLVARHAPDWGASPSGPPTPVATANTPPPAPLNPPPPVASGAPAQAGKKNIFFPSSASIPAVSIMTPEPTGPQQPAAAPDAGAKAATPPASPARKPGPSTQLSRPSSAASSTPPASSSATAPTAPAASAHPAPGPASD
jgi:hypothetical protein